jgi:hypothetical protein
MSLAVSFGRPKKIQLGPTHPTRRLIQSVDRLNSWIVQVWTKLELHKKAQARNSARARLRLELI